MSIFTDLLKVQRLTMPKKTENNFQDRSWLIDRSNLTRVRSIRKSILAEFGVDIQLSQSDLLEQLHRYASKSRDLNLPPMIDHLIDASHSSLAKLSLPKPSTKAIEQSYHHQQEVSPKPKPATNKKAQRIYRGQLVN
ncbi:hypothetical protein [Pelagibaculum spongiae]|uniref:Uncharacterized protein n=1 Tax=Pelagibaculum spongiae TaxID=2080658 RepID=A0A2V1H4S8_9GAMM|nr:hypothetical protein [Pelagibaculum spongiae]PVZ72228.1 hypothetical protein DC094_04230 [Pelagibaculum spongiae]